MIDGTCAGRGLPYDLCEKKHVLINNCNVLGKTLKTHTKHAKL